MLELDDALRVEIVDARGRLVRTVTGERRIALATLPKGILWVRVAGAESVAPIANLAPMR